MTLSSAILMLGNTTIHALGFLEAVTPGTTPRISTPSACAALLVSAWENHVAYGGLDGYDWGYGFDKMIFGSNQGEATSTSSSTGALIPPAV